MKYKFFTCDVFAERRFGGNPLAVLTDAVGLSDEAMQRIAREFNYSETTFILPAERGHDRRARIFTPNTEMDFAGHPNIGAAFVLARTGAFGAIDTETHVAFEEKAGVVEISIRRAVQDSFWCELRAPQALSIGASANVKTVARAVSLDPSDIALAVHPPQYASVGATFLLVELSSRAALERAKPNLPGFETLAATGAAPMIHLYCRDPDGFDLRARMFAPLHGVPEDPATGSANCALAGLLAQIDPAREGERRWRISQGEEMGRPSILQARAEKRDGKVVATWIGGSSVAVAEGEIEADFG